MDSQIFELIIFAVIAFFIITKLISLLGSVDDESYNKKSFFGEDGVFKQGGINSEIILDKSKYSDHVLDSDEKLHHAIIDIRSKIPSFEISDFICKAKKAFNMILSAVNADNNQVLLALVDKSLIDSLVLRKASYAEYDTDIQANITDAYTFGHNCYITIKFLGGNNFSEYWTFSKSAKIKGNVWYLNKVEH